MRARSGAAALLALALASPAHAREVPLTLRAGPVALRAWPLATGVPIPRGELRAPTSVRVKDAAGKEVPIQVEALAQWPDGSVKSLLVQFVGPLSARDESYVLEYGAGVSSSAAPAPAVTVGETADEVTVGTGPAEFRIGKRRFGLEARIREGRRGPLTSLLSRPADLFAVNAFDGQEYRASRDPAPVVVVEERGPVRAVVRASGSLRSAAGGKLLDFIVRLYAYAGQDAVKLDVTVVDPRPEVNVEAARPQLALSVSSYGLELPYALGAATYAFGGDGDSVHTGPVPDGGETHLFQDGRLLYSLQKGELVGFLFGYTGAGRGKKASGWMDVSDASRGLSVCLRNFWQQFPKEWSVQDHTVRVYLHPPRASGPKPDLAYPRLVKGQGYQRPQTFYSPREGMAKTYELLLSFHDGDRAAARPEALNRAFQAAPFPTAPASAYASSGVFGSIVESGPWSAGHDDWLMRQIYEPSIQAFKDSGGLAVMYGWRDFGDRMRGGWCNVDPSGFKIPCFYNDTHLGAHVWFVQYLRTLDPRWRDYAWNATRFFMDIGVSHAPRRGRWRRDYGPGEGHLIKHEIEDHSCPNLHLGHAHLSGMADLYLLTGDRRALEVMREVGDWWVAAVPDIFPTPIRGPHFAEAERDYGWPLFVLNEAYRGTGDPKYLRAGAQIVRHLVEWWQTPSDHLVAGRVAGRNDWTKGTGWWAMNPKCDNCPLGWNGTNPWMAGALLSSLVEFSVYDEDHSFVDGAVLREMMLQTMNYVVKYGWDKNKSCFMYVESQPDSCGSDMLLYFPLLHLYRLAAAGGPAAVRRYDTAPAWLEIARGVARDWAQVKWRGSTSSGFYGYEIAFMPQFFREVVDLARGRPSPGHSSGSP
jgi:hypothetical protein